MCFLLKLYFFNYCSLLLFVMFSIHYYHIEAGTVTSFQALRQAQFFYLYQMASICVFYVYSISALQWLCNADKKGHNPAKRLNKFFSSLYSALVTFLTHFYYSLYLSFQQQHLFPAVFSGHTGHIVAIIVLDNNSKISMLTLQVRLT